MHSISDERNWLTWLVKVRILILMVLLAIELAVIRLTPSPLPVMPFLTGMVLWFVLSLFFLFLVSVWSEHRLQAILQVLADLAMVTLVVHLTGGIDSSLNFLYPLVIVVACMLLPRAWGYLSAALAFILFGTILELDYYLVIPSYSSSHPKLKALQVVIFVNLFAYFAIAYLAGLLMSKLRQVDVQLKDASGALENLQALHENIVQSMSGGVITTGLVFNRFKIEGSAFNGREPNEERYGIQFAALDSWSARLSVSPLHNWTAQYSYGRLEHPEALEPGSQRRQTASAEYVKPWMNGSWATSLVWGRVHKVLENRNLNGYLLETTANFQSRNYAFSRLELVDKDELFPGNPSLPTFRIGAYTFGGARDLVHNHLWQLALGADLTVYSKPAALDAAYGNRPISFQIFLRARPGITEHHH